MARALIDIPETTLNQIDAIAAEAHTSRAALVRLAIQAFIDKNKKTKIKGAFGVLKTQKIDGLTLEQKLRSEW
jgi:metal-responsive CopG/Arc/MetJ family transcriptional regulator